MHTTFLPTLFYLLLILLCWFAKAFLIPAKWYYGKGKELNNPYNLTGALFTFIAALLGILSIAAGMAQEYTEKKNSTTQNNVTVINRITVRAPQRLITGYGLRGLKREASNRKCKNLLASDLLAVVHHRFCKIAEPVAG